MNKFSNYLIAAVVSLTVAVPLTVEAVTDQEVGQAIERIKKYFYEKQDPTDGSWEFRSKLAARKHSVQQMGGETALVVQALLLSGESSQNPNIARALAYLREVEMKGTYAVAFRTHVWSYLPPEYLNKLEADAGLLMEMATIQPLGLFDYTSEDAKRRSRVDHSATQYGMLGLWQASKRGLKIPRKFWERWVNHFINAQREDGGWNYGNEAVGGSTGSMTTAGLTALYVGQQELYRTRKMPEPKISEALDNGLRWLDERFIGVTNPNSGGEYNYYYIYGIERVALASGVRYLNNRDWYQTCASHIVQRVKDTGSLSNDYTKTAFALMFLSRGRYPVWINKLQVPGRRWNNHPNDLFFLSQYLSNQREGEVNWQVVSVNLPPEDWLVAPVAFLASSEPMEFSDAQRAAIKKYLDLGGLLVANPDDGSASFSRSIRDLAQQLYPQYKIRRLPEEHGLYNAWFKIPQKAGLTVHGLSNGARELILLADSDWGFAFQADKEPGDKPIWKLASNLFAYATDRGVLRNRLVPPFDSRVERSSAGDVTVGRARYPGNWLPETAAWDIVSNHVFNRTGLAIGTTSEDEASALDLHDIGSSNLKLIHLAGTDAINLDEPQRAAIKKYVERGGTLLIETVGGHGEFSRSLEKQLSNALNQSPVPLSSSDPVISGSKLDSDGYDIQRVLYRRYTTLRLKPDPRPRLIAYLDSNNRPMIIISHEDLSLGMLGARHWDILGYQPESARKIITNLILWANQQQIREEQ